MLYVCEPDGAYRPATDQEVIARSFDLASRALEARTRIENPARAIEFIRARALNLAEERFSAIWLSSRHDVLTVDDLFVGTVDGCSVHPRTVLKRVIDVGAAAAIFVHNHPSGNPQPSHADEAITRKLVKLLAHVDIRVLDHVVVGAGGSVSLAERGLI